MIVPKIKIKQVTIYVKNKKLKLSFQSLIFLIITLQLIKYIMMLKINKWFIKWLWAVKEEIFNLKKYRIKGGIIIPIINEIIKNLELKYILVIFFLGIKCLEKTKDKSNETIKIKTQKPRFKT